MMQLTSSSTSNYHLFTLLLVLLMFINHHQISANSFSSKSNHQQPSPLYNDRSSEEIDENQSPVINPANNFYLPDKEEMISRDPWSQLFRYYAQRTIYTPPGYHSSPSRSPLNLRRGEIRYIPYPAYKRGIPIEFQKALLAHGIVGRRR